MKKNLYYKTGEHMIGNVDLKDRWNDLEQIIDYDKSHTALDVGCAEGLITLKLARKFKHVTGFDIEPYRIKMANENAKGYNNVSFTTNNFMSYRYAPHHKIFCLGVYHKIKYHTRQRALDSMFKNCKHQLYLRVPVIDRFVAKNVGIYAKEVLDIADKNDFDMIHRSEQRPLHGTIFKFERR
jgi:SAM-dependent methyltransferase